MGGTTLHAGILAQWFEMLLLLLLFLKIHYYGCQWDFTWCNDTYIHHIFTILTIFYRLSINAIKKY